MKRNSEPIPRCLQQGSFNKAFPQPAEKGLKVMALANVLVIGEKRELFDALSRRPAQKNCALSFARSGKDALSRLEEDHDTEVVILDVDTPGLDGVETLKRIKTKRPLVEVILLTGHSAIESAVRAIQAGAYDYLLKPVEMNQLVLTIEKAARRKRQRDRRVLEVYTTPYLTRREREKQIARILGPEAEIL